MSSTLGEKLRQAREERGISINEVAEQTRISAQYLQAIENDDYKPLPGGIFNKGFLKSYARYVGYNEQDALHEYSQLVAAGAEKSQEEEFKSYRPEVLTDERAQASPLPTIIFAGVILTLMTLVILYGLRYIINQPDSAPTVVSNTNTNISNNTAVSTDQALQPANDGMPVMESIKVDFRTSGGPIWLSSISDGKSLVTTITADKPVSFEPRQSLRLAYSKSLASSAQLIVNGRQIALPQVPGNPKRAAIEVELNKENLSRVWQNSKIEAIASPVTGTPTAAVRPAARPANTAVARPANTANTSANRPR